MRCEVRKNYKGGPSVIWNIDGEGLASTDFFKRVNYFELNAIALYYYDDKNNLRVLSPADNFPRGFSFPFGTIFVVKEERL